MTPTERKLRKQIRELKHSLDLVIDDNKRHGRDIDDLVKGLWLMHMVLGWPKFRKGDLYTHTILRELCKRSSHSYRQLSKILKRSSFFVAGFSGHPHEKRYTAEGEPSEGREASKKYRAQWPRP